jgi:hypothetical protein
MNFQQVLEEQLSQQRPRCDIHLTVSLNPYIYPPLRPQLLDCFWLSSQSHCLLTERSHRIRAELEQELETKVGFVSLLALFVFFHPKCVAYLVFLFANSDLSSFI